MPNLSTQMDRYAKYRAQGVNARDAAINAGYAITAVPATVSRLEKRADIQNLIARYKNDDLNPNGYLDQGDKEWKLRDFYATPLELILDVMNNPQAPPGVRIACAKDALPYCHAKRESTKKLEATIAATKAASLGSFKPYRPPTTLRSVKQEHQLV